MDAVVTAGGIPLPGDPLYPATKGNAKALLDIAGKPMIQWVLDALSASKKVDAVILVGMTAKSDVHCSKPLHFVSNQGKIVENLIAGARKVKEINPKAKHVLFVSSDLPCISGEMVDWVVETAERENLDIIYNIIQRETMEERFPEAKRTWMKLRDMDVCGGDINAARLSVVLDDEEELWTKITDSRKNPLKQASLIGFGTALRLATGKLTLQQAEESVMKKMGFKGRAVVCPFAEVGMDVDKMHHLEIVRADLKKRIKKEARQAAAQKKIGAAVKGKASSKVPEKGSKAAKKGASGVKPAGKPAPAGKKVSGKNARK